MPLIVAAARYPDVVPFREMVALRSRVSEEMRRELSLNGSSRVYARLSQLRGAIESDIEGAVAAKAAMEERAVASGAMSEDQTLMSLLSGWRDGWRDEQAARGAASSGVGPDVSGGAGGFSRSRGTAGQGRGQFPDAPGAEGVSAPGLPPNFDEGAAGRLKKASAATKKNARTYERDPVSGVLRGPDSETFTVPSSVVPARFFRPGPRGYEAMQALTKAAPGPETARAIRDYAVSTMRRDAENKLDGTIDPVRFENWRQRHADALRAIPEVAASLENPARASETLAQLAAARKAEIDAFQKGTVGRLLGLSDPADVTRTIGGIFSRQDQVQQMARLARETAGDQQAREGLRKAVADYISTRFVGNIEGGTSNVDLMRSDAFQQFLRQSAPALKQVLSGEEMAGLHAIAADLKRANRSLTAVKIPGQSNTVQDALATAKSGTDAQSWLSRLLSPGALAGAGAAAGSTVGGGLGAAIGGGAGAHFGRVIEALRKSGLQSVDEIVRDALLNPDRARALLAKVPDRPTKTQAINLARVYMRAALLPVVGDETAESRRGKSGHVIAKPPAASATITPAERLLSIGP
ncbi:hypothetical protein [Roseixanthobacter liquoris]|uniref:hypothetical protein n=1 Tax=Roseixanthobacter liquoris TaxID=3119921 RepID=UPI003728B469